MEDLEKRSQVEINTIEKIQKLSDILLETKCRDLKSRDLTIFPKKDVYHLPSSRRKVTILGSCRKVKKYSFCERYYAKRELKELYNELSEGEEKDKIKDILSKTRIYSWLIKKMFPS